MARLQNPVVLPSVTIAVGGTGQSLYPSGALYVKSFTIQALSTNTGIVSFGDSTTQSMTLTAGRAATFYGDNMDNGTSARINVSDVYVTSTVAGDGVAIICLENL